MDKQEYLGARDLPLKANETDLLDTQKYVDALVKFTSTCCTPMSVALQGDWGTGKTSFINRMKDSLDKQKNIKTVYFNTWQYSQFNSPEDLYTSFAACLIESLSAQTKEKTPGEFSGKAKDFMCFLIGAGVDLGRQYVDNKFGFDLEKVQEGTEKVLSRITKKNNQIKDLKKTFSELITDSAGDNGRVIIFIDDLDRLNPEIAVALLETIKLFMDVEKCVFVLAIDYDVVVRGIRKKYGNDMDEIKCRSFFDKIIQLPFRMPTEKYVIRNMIESTSIGEKITGYVDVISNLIKDSLGPNPRTLKRLINSFELLTLVEGAQKEEYKNALLLVSLIMQIFDEKEYSELLESADDIEVFKKYEENRSIQDDEETNGGRSISPFFVAIKKIGEICGKPIEEDFINILSLSAMTTVAPGSSSPRTVSTHSVTSIILNGKEIPVETPTAAIRETVTRLLEDHQDRIDEVLTKYDKTFTTDPDASKSMFAAKNELDIGGRVIYLAIKTSYDQKLKLVRKLCKDFGVPESDVQWFDGDTELLWERQ